MIMENIQIPDRRTRPRLQLPAGRTSPRGQTHNRVLISDASAPPADAATALPHTLRFLLVLPQRLTAGIGGFTWCA